MTDAELLAVASAVGVVRRRPRVALALLAWQVATPAELDEHLAELAAGSTSGTDQ